MRVDSRRELSCKLALPAAVIIPAVRDHDAVLFDLDGVLLDSRASCWASFACTRRWPSPPPRHRPSPSRCSRRSSCGRSQQELRDAGADALVENADELARVLREHRQ